MTTRTSILLVDDDTMVRQALEHALVAENYFVVPAANRDEALHQIEKHRIDILLVDLHPWKEDGWETVQRLTAIRARLPVIAMTARIEEQTRHTDASDAIDALLEKPLNLPILMKTLKEIASQKMEPRHQEMATRR